MAVEIPPCKGCTDRHTNCHSDCKKYVEYTERIKAAREAEAKRHKESWDLTCVRRGQVVKIGKNLRRRISD